MYKKTLFATCFLLLSNLLLAQTMKVRNQPYGDYRLYHFGINVGLNFQDILLTNSGTVGDGETWYGTIPNYSAGFTVGLAADLFLNPYMNLRFSPMLCFGDKEFEFVEPEKKESFKTNVRSNYLMAPLDLKIRSMRLNNYRPYVFAGVYSAVDLGRKKDEPVLLKQMDYGASVGLGCDFYLPFVKLIPEIRFCFGLSDILEQNRSDLTDHSLEKYQKSLSKGVSRMIIFTFYFE
ncbi:MAG: PorT family protein [Dysgonamonadaceae bacterium]|nr:PorT family protein [Dysgonamonadaceae bacterium]